MNKKINKGRFETKQARILFNLTFGRNASEAFISY